MKELFSIYKNLNEAQLQKLTDIAQAKKIEDDTLILEKDQKNTLLYVLKTGEAHILDNDPHTPQNNLAILGIGCTFGAVSSFRCKKTIADVLIKKGSIVDIINIDKIDKKSALYQILKENVTDEFVNEVQKINQGLLHKYSDEMKFSLFLQVLLISLSLGMMFSSFSITFSMKPDLVWIWVYFIFLLPGPCYYIYKINESISRYGVSLHNLKQNIIEGFVISLLCVALLCLIAISIQSYTKIGLQKVMGHIQLWWVFLIYCFHSYLQEFVARGLLQTTIQDVVQKKSRAFAIVVASLVFAVTHITYGFYTVTLVFIMGIFFGFLYARFKNLVGVTIVHAITGEFFFMYVHAWQANSLLSPNVF